MKCLFMHKTFQSTVNLDGCQALEPFTQDEVIEQKYVPLFPHLSGIHLLFKYDEALAPGQYVIISLWDDEKCLVTKKLFVKELGNLQYTKIDIKAKLNTRKEYTWKIDTANATDCQLSRIYTDIEGHVATENKEMFITGYDIIDYKMVNKYEYIIHISSLYIIQLWILGVIFFFCSMAFIDEIYSAKYDV